MTPSLIQGDAGRFAVADLTAIAAAARQINAEHFAVLPSQDIQLLGESLHTESREWLAGIGMGAYAARPLQITASTAALGIRPARPWLDEAVFYSLIQELHDLKLQTASSINIVCPLQDLQPRFAGRLNVIAAERRDFWHVFVRPGNDAHALYEWPYLVGSRSLAPLAAQLLLSESLESLQQAAAAPDAAWALAPVEQTLPPAAPLPYLDAVFSDGITHSVSITAVGNTFSLYQIEHILRLAAQQQIGDIHTTSWGGLLVKNIAAADLPGWHTLLQQNHLSIGRPYAQTVWQYRPNDAAARELQQLFVQQQLQNGLRMWGRSISVNPDLCGLDASLLIQSRSQTLTRRPLFSLFAMQKNRSHKRIAQDLPLGDALTALTEYCSLPAFSDGLNHIPRLSAAAAQTVDIHRCGDCLAVYAPEYGEPAQGIAAGTAFADLPASFHCPVCDADLMRFHTLSQ